MIQNVHAHGARFKKLVFIVHFSEGRFIENNDYITYYITISPAKWILYFSFIFVFSLKFLNQNAILSSP